MRLRAALTLAAMVASCTGASSPEPKLPTLLAQHDEAPYGDAVNHRRVTALLASLDRLEPQWGKLDAADYTIARSDADRLWPAIEDAIPAGWTPVALGTFAPRDGELRAWSTGKHLFAVLRINPGIPSDIPVVILRDRRTH